MRLIDADKYFDELCKLGEQDELDFLQFYKLASLLDNQPTAYDVDKVVEQLEKQIGTCEMKDCGKYGSDCDACRAGKAIEIVKAGGVNE